MPAQASVSVDNNFRNGLITEATGLNFPEAAVTETYDCEFNLDGSVSRREGFDFEIGYETKTIDRSDKAITTYMWQNVAGNGDLSVLVVQIGNKLYFYEADNATGNFSTGASASTVTLTPVSGAAAPDTVEAQFCDGNGYLFVTHPFCEPMRISYESSTATATNITIKVRDFTGATADPYTTEERPTATLAALNVSHKYNLYNQGWNTTNLTAWDTAQTTMPSNADVMWRFKDSSENFDASTASINRITLGNTLAPKGHFILTLANQDRDTASGLSGVAATTTTGQRPSTAAFHAGRVFYAGINFTGFNSNIYFTQVVERTEQYGFCYQYNDPTAEDLFDLLPTDGGHISIPEAGTIIKLVSVPGGLCAFAAHGVWFITGSQGIGFTANDYSVQKIANISCLTASSFVNVAGYPCWWNAEGIYLMLAQGNLPNIQSLTDKKIKSFYNEIPLASKRFAKGFYHSVDGVIRWVYKSEATGQIDDIYVYDRVLNFNTLNGAFYPWTISDSDVKVHAVIPTDSVSRAVTALNVIAGADTVIDASGNTVIAYQDAGNENVNFDKYLVSYAEDSSYEFTFADTSNENYLDWETYGPEGINYDSYFITGYKLRGQGIRKFQSNWVRIFSRIDNPVSYGFQGIWDYASTGSGTGRWSVRQNVNHTDTDYSTASARLKVRGHGLALQFKVSSVEGEPFDVIGWSEIIVGNSGP